MQEVKDTNEVKYVGFWARSGASLIDGLLMMVFMVPLTLMVYGPEYYLADTMITGPADILINYILPAVAVILFWTYKAATPGKMAVKAIIVDANTGDKASKGQLIGRYLAYFISMIPLFLGFFWVGFDKRKQGWHDKLAGTVVIRKPAKIEISEEVAA